MKGAREIKPIGVRMPPEIRERLKEKADKSHRSLGGEIIFRLEESLNREDAAKDGEQSNG